MRQVGRARRQVEAGMRLLQAHGAVNCVPDVAGINLCVISFPAV